MGSHKLPDAICLEVFCHSVLKMTSEVAASGGMSPSDALDRATGLLCRQVHAGGHSS